MAFAPGVDCGVVASVFGQPWFAGPSRGLAMVRRNIANGGDPTNVTIFGRGECRLPDGLAADARPFQRAIMQSGALAHAPACTIPAVRSSRHRIMALSLHASLGLRRQSRNSRLRSISPMIFKSICRWWVRRSRRWLGASERRSSIRSSRAGGRTDHRGQYGTRVQQPDRP